MNKEQLILDNIDYMHKLPNEQFSMVTQTPRWSLVIYKFIEFVDPQVINLTKHQYEFPLFELYQLQSLSILSAYIFFIPVCHVRLNPYFMRLLLPSAKHLRKFCNVKLAMQDSRITFFYSHDGAGLVSVNGLKRVITPVMVRRSEKNMFAESNEL